MLKRSRWLWASVGALLLAIVVLVPVARAVTSTTITFDPPAAPSLTSSSPLGPAVGYGSPQLYANDGIDFVSSASQDLAHPVAIESNCAPYLYWAGSTTAHSGQQVLADGCSNTVSQSAGWLARLHNSASMVSLYVGGGAAGVPVQLTGYDFEGDVVAQVTATLTSTVDTPMSISTGSPDIFFFSVQIPTLIGDTSSPALEVDDLTFDNPGGGTPEILLNDPGAGDGANCAWGFQGGTTTCTIDIERFNGANNALTLAPSIAPPGWLTLTGGTAVAAGADSAPLTFKVGSAAPPHGVASIAFGATASGSPAVSVTPVPMNIAVAVDFYLMPDYDHGDSVSLQAGGGPQTLPIHVFTTGAPGPGSIKLSHDALPTGVTLKFSPGKVSTVAGEHTVTLSLRATPVAAPVSGQKVTVVGKFAGSPSISPETLPIRVTVSTYDLRAQGLEVTQGTQLDYQSFGVGTLLPSGTSPVGQPGGGAPYQGVPLVSNKKTVVRFFADAWGAPEGVTGVKARITAFRGGKQIGFVWADYGPDNGTSTAQTPLLDTEKLYPAPVLPGERIIDTNAFTFTLPDAWTTLNGGGDTLTLVAQVFPPFDNALQECGAAPKPPGAVACPDNTFTLRGVTFTPTGPALTVTPIRGIVNGQTTGTVTQAFADLKAATPLPDNGVVLLPYAATWTITSVVTAPGQTPAMIQGNLLNALTSAELPPLGNPTNAAVVTPGVNTAGVTSAPGDDCPPTYPGISCFNGAYKDVTDGGPSITDFGSAQVRPLTSVTHEMFHQFGLVHASVECGGGADGDSDDATPPQTGEPWPLDDNGDLDGVALNPTSEPYNLIANGLNGFPTAFDLMSYCAGPAGQVGSGDPNVWISPRNWEALFTEFTMPPGPTPAARDALAVTSRTASRSPRAGAVLDPKVLRVSGFQDADGLFVSTVGPRIGPPLPQGSSPYRLIARGAAGNTLASVPMTEENAHADQIDDFVTVDGEVPAAGVASVAIVSPSGQVATRSRPAIAPRVTVLTPGGNHHAPVGGKRPVAIQWHSTNPQHLELTAQVDYSADGGRSWRLIYAGPDNGHVSLPPFYFAPTRDARVRVRVRVNDSFNETVAVSARFSALDPPPQVAIVSPIELGGRRIAGRLDGDALAQLEAVAFDARLRMLPGANLRWFDGRAFLGTGRSLLTGPLPPGVNRITVVARDPAGRTAVASTTLLVSPVDVPFLHLKLPTAVSPGARELAATTISAVPATLRVGRHTFVLRAGQRRRLVIAIASSHAPVFLHIVIDAHGVQIPFAALLART